MIDRRAFIGAAAGTILLPLPQMAFAQAATPRRLVFIIQRGAADGLATLAPVGDPAFASVRRDFAQDSSAARHLGDFFALHPGLAEAGRLYASNEALFVHAVASAYRSRSHFDGQNVLESGGNAAYVLSDGWMNRLLGLLPRAEAKAIAVSPAVPLVLRGSHEVASYAPSALPQAPDDLLARISAMYEHDAQLGGLWREVMATRSLTGDLAQGDVRNGAALGALAGRLMAGAEGARLAVVETIGWDTHAGQRARLGLQLRSLDALLASLRSSLGEAWRETLVMVATEFGRTASPNGTGGTDHGTASLAMLFGGALAGGRVIADWPGLAPSSLFEQRDLRPTLALETVIASAAAQHFQLAFDRTAATLFPGRAGLRELQGLVRS
jgi:uncharacterized protein (DUF1501 family)